MQFFAKAVITGFGLSLGAALYKKVAKQLGFEEEDKASEQVRQQDGATDPNLQRDPQPQYS
ncbi:MAG: hypothetical protein JNL83_31790 [Myxococcales bacterium]|nr:hypothetical protein [Myxococcales bacterium]